ncbi:cell division protein ZapA (FtsZ GTPase activity inhibitor) [Alkalihalobacillus hemicentroti]|uniref:Cell division protein ZapA (FtsZ GTPase activity inhibitor) n=1 Tax=Guptibacillus hwajinpoensis TaxID=208199 RepID=A0ABU0K164_9BACL|nr:cell division protein ZapA (FtsZ GTPase activity inhibitor) [Alkalihalobacillus hemicentroti]
MFQTIVWISLILVLFTIVTIYKYKKLKKSIKKWEGKNPLERTKSTEELRQNENKHRNTKGGF